MAVNIIDTNNGFLVKDSDYVQISNLVESELFAFNLKGGTMSNLKDLQFRIFCNLSVGAGQVNSGASITFTFKFGSYTLPIFTSSQLAPISPKKPFIVNCFIVNLYEVNKTNAQTMYASLEQGAVLFPQLTNNAFSSIDTDLDLKADQRVSVLTKFNSSSATPTNTLNLSPGTVLEKKLAVLEVK